MSRSIRVRWTSSYVERVDERLYHTWIGGDCDLSLDSLPHLCSAWADWDEYFSEPPGEARANWTGLEASEHARTFPLLESYASDLVVLVDAGPLAGEVRVLAHDSTGGLDGARLGRSLHEFLDTWFRLACPELNPADLADRDLYDRAERRLSLDTPGARRRLEQIRVGVNPTPPIRIAAADGYVECPTCGERFRVSSRRQWSGERHRVCSQRLEIVSDEPA